MDRIIESLGAYWHVWLVGALLVFIAAGFFAKFIIPAIRLRAELNATITSLLEIKKKGGGNLVDLTEIAQGPMSHDNLAHCWAEYSETLHPQREVDQTGQSRVVRWRATTLAETFFSEQAIVSTPLKADFYKHLPGILTGLGIIGTFLGLIFGLSSFDATDPAKAQAELQGLINAVGHAFFVSAAAITLAMLFTWVEKSLVTACSRNVTAIRQLIDSLFDAGAGEEYLERLVVASESQATQAAHIKDALVADLKEILTTLTERQLEEQKNQTTKMLQAQAEQSGRISEDMAKAIAEHLGRPIADIADAVKKVGANQGDAVNKLLTDVLAGFSEQVRDMFGGQMRGMTDLLKETSDAMRQSAEKFSMLAADMDRAGKGTVDAMGERLNDALTAMEARQAAINSQMSEFVEQIKGLVAKSQSESARKLQESLAQIGEQVAAVVAELRAQAESAAASQGERQGRFEDSTRKAIDSLSTQMEALLEQSVETSRALQQSVKGLSDATNDSIKRMGQGADTLFKAATDFAAAGQGVSETMRASSEATVSIKSASAALSTATSAAKDIIADYARTRDAFSSMVSELKLVTENARRDAAMTTEIVARMESAAVKLKEAQRLSEEYLKGVSDVLTKTHESFASSIGKTLQESNRGFQKELRAAVDMVSAAVKDLGDTLEEIPGRGK